MSSLTRRVQKVLKNPTYLLWAASIKATVIRKRVAQVFSPRPEFTRQKRVVMFHLGRSGSTVMADLLNQHHDIYWGGEIAKETLRENLPEKDERIASFTKNLDLELSASKKHHAYGFEIKPFHLRYLGVTPIEFRQMMRSRGFDTFIILERKNLLRKVLSSMIASKYDVWHQPKTVESVAKVVEVDPFSINIDGQSKSLLEFFRDYEEDLRQIRLALKDDSPLELSYENDVSPSPVAAAQMCFAHVGASSERPAVRYGRTNPQKISEIVTNFDELEDVLSGTEYEWMLHS